VLTVADIIALLLAGMPVFDAVCIAFGTAGTGGFGVLNTSCAAYPHAAQNITTVFMLLFGVNFGLYHLLLLKNFKAVLRDEELRLYLGIVAASILAITVNIVGRFADTMALSDAVRHAAFQVASIVTTTGYSTTDFDLWPNFSRAILLMLMLVGACGGSTGGGLKMVRALLLMKELRRNALRVMRTSSTQPGSV
jgi:trk system potassium uptake protein TrkH